MIPLLKATATKTTKLACGACFVVMCSLVNAHGAETTREAPPADDAEAIPQPLKSDVFEALMASSPFTRSLGLSDSLILTGVARFDKDVFATILDTQTMESQVVSRTPNRDGWQLVGLTGDPEKVTTWTARIQVPGGEIVSIRYQKTPPKSSRSGSGLGGSGSSGGSGSGAPSLSSSQLEAAKKAAVNYREGFDADGYPNQPPPEMVQKLSRLSVDQRENINREMFGLRTRGLGMDERRRIYENLVDRASQGRR